MKDTSIILSISMLVSGREEMTKSLESLRMFKEAFPCEVILVDTGCGPEQRALAEKYADRIIDFEWCNDFAAARNVGLREARGEWFMYMDDDEWFEDPGEIIDFFTSGEYKQYKSATYIQRNYRDMHAAYYVDSYPSRLTELTPETKFVGKIHEYFEPYGSPQKDFKAFVHHFGYVYKDEEEGKQHSLRNVRPLLELMEENPGEPRWICQLAQEYLSIHEYEKIREVCQKGLADWRERAVKENFAYAPAHLGGVYVYLLIAMEALKRYEEEEEWLEIAFADPNVRLKKLEPTVAFLCVLGAKLYLNLKDYKRSAEYLRRYIDYVVRLKDDRAVLESGAALIVTAVFQEPFLYDSVLVCLEAAIRAEDRKLAEDALALIDWDKSDMAPVGGWEQKTLDAFCSVAYHPTWVKLLRTLCDRPQGMQEMAAIFVETEEKYRKGEEKAEEGEEKAEEGEEKAEEGEEKAEEGEEKAEEGEEYAVKLSRLHHLVAELDVEHWYVLCMKILWADEETEKKAYKAEREEPRTQSEEKEETRLRSEERGDKVKALFSELFGKHRDGILAFPSSVWEVAERYGLSAENEIQQIPYRDWKKILDGWCRMAPVEEIRRWETWLEGWQESNEHRELCEGERSGFAAVSGAGLYIPLFSLKCAEGYLHHYQEACPGLEEMARALWGYADAVLALYRPCVKEFVFEEAPGILPDEAQLALGLKELQQYQEQGDDLKALESLRKCLGIHPDMDPEISAYAAMYRDEVQKRDREAREARDELRQLVSMLKRMAKQQIEKGEYQAAKEILMQVKQVAPEDAEVLEMCRKVE